MSLYGRQNHRFKIAILCDVKYTLVIVFRNLYFFIYTYKAYGILLGKGAENHAGPAFSLLKLTIGKSSPSPVPVAQKTDGGGNDLKAHH